MDKLEKGGKKPHLEENRKKLRHISRYMRDQLRKCGLYRPELGYQIDLTARNVLLYRQLSDACMSLPDVTVTERSREGDPRVRIHPLFEAVKKQAEIVRRDLTVLYMNRGLKKDRSDEEQAGGGLDALMEALTGGGETAGDTAERRPVCGRPRKD